MGKSDNKVEQSSDWLGDLFSGWLDPLTEGLSNMAQAFLPLEQLGGVLDGLLGLVSGTPVTA